jgi:esterase/lipase superfamily enzyme
MQALDAAGDFVVRIVGALAIVALLGGCATQPPSPACTVGQVAPDGSSRVTIYYATNRTLPEGEAAPNFGYGRGHVLQFGALTVAIPPAASRSYGSTSGIQIVAARPYESEAQFTQALRIAMAQRASSLRPRTAAPPRRLLTYIHGYNNKFDSAAVRLAQFVQDGCLGHVPVLMSWPSRGTLLDYEYDEDSATYSRPYLGRTLELVTAAAGSQRVDILAHSMGNWLTLETLRRWRWRHAAGKFGTIVFASPDVDLAVFKQGIDEIEQRGGISHVAALMTNHEDNVLALSRFLVHGEPRAGDASHQQIEEAGLKTSKRFVVLYVRRPELNSCGPGGHDCYAYDQAMLESMRNLFANSDISGTRRTSPLAPVLMPLQLPGDVINSVEGAIAR